MNRNHKNFIQMQIGSIFGRLTTVGLPYKLPTEPYYRVECLCECGNYTAPRKADLTKKINPTLSCGCLQRDKSSGFKGDIPIGETFHYLTILEDLGNKGKRRHLLARCVCGNVGEFRWDQVKSNNTRSCGCYQKERVSGVMNTHGMSGSRTHDIWTAMKQRCTNPRSSSYGEYGGRGISYDPRWESFENFFEDMGECPENLTLDRIDVDLGYSKENCRWASDSVQVHNQRKRSGRTTSKFKGVYFNKEKGKWHARLHINHSKPLNKYFNSEIEAARAYDEESFKIYGDRPNETKIEQYLNRGI